MGAADMKRALFAALVAASASALLAPSSFAQDDDNRRGRREQADERDVWQRNSDDGGRGRGRQEQRAPEAVQSSPAPSFGPPPQARERQAAPDPRPQADSGWGGQGNGRRDWNADRGAEWSGRQRDPATEDGDRRREGDRRGESLFGAPPGGGDGDWARRRREGENNARRGGDWGQENRGDNQRGDWNRDDHRRGDWNRDDHRRGDWNRDDHQRGDWTGRDHDWGRDWNGRHRGADWRNWDWNHNDHRYDRWRHSHRDFSSPRYRDWRGIRHGYYFDDGYRRIVHSFFGWDYYWWSYPNWRRPHRPWAVGHYLPRYIWWEPVPYDLYYRLPPAPYGCRYIMVDRDILLIAVASGLILDALIYYDRDYYY